MPISYPEILALSTSPKEFSWSRKDTILYALGLGFGRDPLDERELRFVFEKNLVALPTLATIVGRDANPPIGQMVNMLLTVHGEQSLTIHKPIPVEGRLIADGRILDVLDKGADKGAVILGEVRLSLPDGELLATLTRSSFARGDGGFGGSAGGAHQQETPPSRKPDITVDLETRPDQALLYRLSGDYNPLHANPAVAQAAGFPRPILHGLCTYGLALRAILVTVADYDVDAVMHLATRFSAPVFPGETVSFHLWSEDRELWFTAYAGGRRVLSSGRARLR